MKCEPEHLLKCPRCKRGVMVLKSADPGVFAGCVFATYACRECKTQVQESFLPWENN